MTVVRKLTFFTVRHDIHMLFRLYSLVNQKIMRTESCTTGYSPQAWRCISWLIVMKCSAIPISQLRYPLTVILLKASVTPTSRTVVDRPGLKFGRSDIKGMRSHQNHFCLRLYTRHHGRDEPHEAEQTATYVVLTILTLQQNENPILMARARKLADKKRKQKLEKEATKISNRKRWIEKPVG